MYNTLQEIKEQLFDAPVEVKEAFNTVVGYFDHYGKGKFGNSNRVPAVAGMERPRGGGKGVVWGPTREAFIYLVPESALHPSKWEMSAKEYCEGYADEKGAKFLEFVGVFRNSEEARAAAQKLDTKYEEWNKKNDASYKK